MAPCGPDADIVGKLWEKNPLCCLQSFKSTEITCTANGQKTGSFSHTYGNSRAYWQQIFLWQTVLRTFGLEARQRTGTKQQHPWSARKTWSFKTRSMEQFVADMGLFRSFYLHWVFDGFHQLQRGEFADSSMHGNEAAQPITGLTADLKVW